MFIAHPGSPSNPGVHDGEVVEVVGASVDTVGVELGVRVGVRVGDNVGLVLGASVGVVEGVTEGVRVVDVGAEVVVVGALV